jgi:hypothetical protein
MYRRYLRSPYTLHLDKCLRVRAPGWIIWLLSLRQYEPFGAPRAPMNMSREKIYQGLTRVSDDTHRADILFLTQISHPYTCSIPSRCTHCDTSDAPIPWSLELSSNSDGHRPALTLNAPVNYLKTSRRMGLLSHSPDAYELWITQLISW